MPCTWYDLAAEANEPRVTDRLSTIGKVEGVKKVEMASDALTAHVVGDVPYVMVT